MDIITKLLILDMDGVILSSESSHRKAFEQIKEICAQGRDVCAQNVVGASCKQVYKALLDACPPCSFTADELAKRHYLDVWKLLEESHKAVAEPGLLDLLKAASEKGYGYAIASCSPKWFVESCLQAVGILDGAQILVCGDSGLPVKPNPALFLETLKQTGVAKEQALVIEDSCSGTQAALAAGINCIAYRNPDTGNQDLSAAGRVVNSLKDVIEFL